MLNDLINTRVGVFIDEANIYHSQKNLGWKIDYRKLRKHLETIFNISQLRIYKSIFKNNHSEKKRIRFLVRNRYIVITKPIKFIKTKDGVLKKGNLDIELALDAGYFMSTFDVFMLFSGDSDFACLIKMLKTFNKKIVVLSTGGHVSRELLILADYYVDLKRLRTEISKPLDKSRGS